MNNGLAFLRKNIAKVPNHPPDLFSPFPLSKKDKKKKQSKKKSHKNKNRKSMKRVFHFEVFFEKHIHLTSQ